MDSKSVEVIESWARDLKRITNEAYLLPSCGAPYDSKFDEIARHLQAARETINAIAYLLEHQSGVRIQAQLDAYSPPPRPTRKGGQHQVEG